MISRYSQEPQVQHPCASHEMKLFYLLVYVLELFVLNVYPLFLSDLWEVV